MGIGRGNMHLDKIGGMTLEEYKALEIELHTELMKICRKYINELSIISLTGVLDIVKQETAELERATSKRIEDEESEAELEEEADTVFSIGERMDR